MKPDEICVPDRFLNELEPKQRAILLAALEMFLHQNHETLMMYVPVNETCSVLEKSLKQICLWLIEESSHLIGKLSSGYPQQTLELERYLQETLDRQKRKDRQAGQMN